ncbi:MAG: 2OG-Fe(II) oxygenase family protein [bacterium]
MVTELAALHKKWPQHPDICHLLALAYKAVGDVTLAEKCFIASLSAKYVQPQVHNNLANLYNAESIFDRAVSHYQEAIRQKPDYHEAIRNLALCYGKQGAYRQAIDTLKIVLRSHSKDVTAMTAIADAYRETGQHRQAEQNYEQALAVQPDHVNAWHNRGLNQHLTGHVDQALQYYKHALELRPDQPEVVESVAMALHERGSTAEGAILLENFLTQNPTNTHLHERLNEVIWESTDSAKFGSSYEQAISRSPDSLDLRTSFIGQLIRAGQLERASEHIKQALQHLGNVPQLLGLQGRLLADQGDFDAAYQQFKQGLEPGFSEELSKQMTKLCVINERYTEAQNQVSLLLKNKPDCQLSWAYQSLVWRLTGNAKYQWLIDYDKFVRGYELETPEGYGSIEEFLQQLISKLHTLHRTINAPLNQTLRNGTQTAARLFHLPDPEIQSLQAALRVAVQAYIDDMGTDAAHPLLRRKTGQFEFSGSWSVKLKPKGFHVNHVHPAGWISSSCYVSIPSSMTDQPDSEQGSIKFGESPLALGSREVIEKTISPRAGMVVLFPSYTWHGTIPFEGPDEAFRMTTPFDAVPI